MQVSLSQIHQKNKSVIFTTISLLIFSIYFKPLHPHYLNADLRDLYQLPTNMKSSNSF